MQITMEVAVPVVETALKKWGVPEAWSSEEISQYAQEWAIARSPQQVLKPTAVACLLEVFANLDLGI